MLCLVSNNENKDTTSSTKHTKKCQAYYWQSFVATTSYYYFLQWFTDLLAAFVILLLQEWPSRSCSLGSNSRMRTERGGYVLISLNSTTTLSANIERLLSLLRVLWATLFGTPALYLEWLAVSTIELHILDKEEDLFDPTFSFKPLSFACSSLGSTLLPLHTSHKQTWKGNITTLGRQWQRLRGGERDQPGLVRRVFTSPQERSVSVSLHSLSSEDELLSRDEEHQFLFILAPANKQLGGSHRQLVLAGNTTTQQFGRVGSNYSSVHYYNYLSWTSGSDVIWASLSFPFRHLLHLSFLLAELVCSKKHGTFSWSIEVFGHGNFFQLVHDYLWYWDGWRRVSMISAASSVRS